MSVALRIIKGLGRLPLPVRRRVLRALWRATLPFRKEVGFGLEPTFERFLRLGAKPARRLALEHDHQDILLIMEWHASIARNHRQIVHDWRNTRVSDAPLVERIAASNDVVILAALHMGVFPMGITYVVWKYFADRRLLVLRAREDLAENNIAMDRLREVASELRILNTRNEADFVDAMRFIRKGGVVVSLLDLPETYGSPADTTLFGEPAAIALGLDAMARMLKAVVLPMTVRSLPSRDEIVFGQPFEVSRTAPDERRSIVRAVSRQIEQFVALAPEQWHMWTRIAEFYPDRVRSRTRHATQAAGEAEAHVGV